MEDERFAFEFEQVSIAFSLTAGLGDCIIARKVFDALVELEPSCIIDIFYEEEHHRIFAEAFYGSCKNLNRIVPRKELHSSLVHKKNLYDLPLRVFGSHYINLEKVNSQRLQVKSPALSEAASKINNYNQQNVNNIVGISVSFRNMILGQILNKNCYSFLASNGALPIYDDKVNISLLSEYESEFNALNLTQYITFYTDTSSRTIYQKRATKAPCFSYGEEVA